MLRRLLIIAACSDALSLTSLLKRSRNRARGRRVLEDFSTPWQLDIRKGKTGVLYAEESGAQKPTTLYVTVRSACAHLGAQKRSRHGSSAATARCFARATATT